MHALLSDSRHALRTFRRSPGFTVAAVLSLALGIGGATAIFSVVDGVLLRPLPYPDADRIVKLGRTSPLGPNDSLSAADFLDIQGEATTLRHVAGYREDISDVTGSGTPNRVRGVQTTAAFFEVFSSPPLAGRMYTPADEGRGALAVLSEGFWRRQYGARADIIGTQIRINGVPTEIVGVAPAALRHPHEAEVWMLTPGRVPVSPIPTDGDDDRDVQYFTAVARLAPGAAPGDANAQLQAIGARLAEQFPDTNGGESFGARPFAASMVADVRTGLLVLLGAVTCVLLIACANVAGLMLARGLARRRELAVRASLGASSARLAQQLLTESLLLAIAGGAVGLLVAAWGIDLLLAMAPDGLPRLGDVRLDWRVATAATLATTVVGLLAGLAPAWQSARPRLNEDLKDGGRTGTTLRTRLRSALVVAEVAGALALLVAAGLMATSLSRLRGVEPGFRTEQVTAIPLPLPQSRYDGPAQGRFYNAVLERLHANPATARSAVVFPLPFRGNNAMAAVQIEGQPVLSRSEQQSAELNMVSPDYFETMGLPLLRGRAFAPSDVEGGLPVAIVNERMAGLFGDRDPIGRRVDLGMWVTVVGVVADARREALDVAPKPALFLPADQFTVPFMSVVVHSDLPAATLSSTVAAVVRELDPDLPVEPGQTMTEVLDASTGQPRFRTFILIAFATLALVLAVVGIYGLMSYSVAQRTAEMGVRVALGASPRQIGGLVLAHGLTLAGLGIGLGLATAAGASRALTSLLYETPPLEPRIFLGLSALLLTIAALACYVPARRAMRVDPAQALRGE
jgi:putative ABC transport system permease protein